MDLLRPASPALPSVPTSARAGSPVAAGSPRPGAVRLEIGALNERNLAAVLSLVAHYPPFSDYSFGLMVTALTEQLRFGGNVLAIHDGRLVGYGGWRRVQAAAAANWFSGVGELPTSDWQGGAAIVTVMVMHEAALAKVLIRAVSHVCAGLPVYRLRSFQDGRPDMRRPPIVGRRHQFAAA